MKKNIYFIISSILQILLAINTILTADKIIQEQISSIEDVYQSFPQQFQQEMINSLQSSGAILIRFFAITIIVFAVITLITALQNKIIRRKVMLITFSAITAFITESYFILLLAIVSLIILVCLERKKTEDFPSKEKKKIPEIERRKISVKDIILGIVLVLIYFSSLIWVDYLPDSRKLRIIVTIVYDLIVLLIAILVFFKDLKIGLKALKDNFGAYMKFILPRVGIMFVCTIILTISATIVCNVETSVNQAAVETLPKWYSIPMAVIWAPIVEELLFRGVLRRLVKNNIVFIVLSGIIFGLLHTVAEVSLVNTIVMAIPYSFVGAFLAYIYTKTNNITLSISGHAIYNFVGAMLSLI